MPERSPIPNPGPELNALVAEKVMGLKVKWLDPTGFNLPENYGPCLPEDLHGPGVAEGEPKYVLPYSTSIAAAWGVVEKFTLGGIAVHCCRREEWGDARWECVIAIPAQGRDVVASADTAPHAICLAALKACEGRTP